MSRSTRRFIRHCLEMLAAMGLGMLVLGMAVGAVVDTSDRPALMLTEMAVTMTVPMVVWMRVRGHRWRPCAEMTTAMLLPAAGVLVLLGADLVTGTGLLLIIEHAVMLPAMLVAMLLRREEYSGPHHSRQQAT